MITRLEGLHAAGVCSLEVQARSGASRAQLLAALQDEQAWVAGYWQESVLLGYALLVRLPFDAELQAIGVSPEAQGQGVGRQLLDACVAAATQWSSERLLLEVRAGNQRAIALYRRAGFAQDGCRKGYYPAAEGTTGREDALLMSRSLP